MIDELPVPQHPLPDSVYHLYGFLSPLEMRLLYDLAAAAQPNRAIVEIGSFQGKSTVCLGLGAKHSGARVYAIDPHDDEQINAETLYGMSNHAALLMNLCLHGVADAVRVVALPSLMVADSWWKNYPIDLLWIDGSHEYPAVSQDLKNWSCYTVGKILVHDSSGHFPGVTHALQEFLMTAPWKPTAHVDAITVLERA